MQKNVSDLTYEEAQTELLFLANKISELEKFIGNTKIIESLKIKEK